MCVSIGLFYDQTFGLISNMFLEFEKDKYDFFAIFLSLLKVKYTDVIRDVSQTFHRLGLCPSKDYLSLMGYWWCRSYFFNITEP